MIRAHIYFLADVPPPLPLFLLPLFLPPTLSSALPPPVSPNTAQTGRWLLEGKEPSPYPELPILVCTSSTLAPSLRFQFAPFSSAQIAGSFICLPISIPHPSLSLSGAWSTPLDLSPKMAPRTLNTGPAAAHDPRQRPRGWMGGPQPALLCVWSVQNARTFSRLGVGRRQPAVPKVEPADRRRGKCGGRTIQVQRHGDGGSGGAELWRGRVRHLQRRGCAGERGKGSFSEH